MDYSGLSFKDLTIFQGFKPDPADPDMWGWWDADEHITGSSVNIWGDHSDNTVDKTVASGRNLSKVLGDTLYYSTADNTENLIPSSNNLVVWSYSDAASDSATLMHFTAQNGTVSQTSDDRTYERAAAYTLTMDIKWISGNTALQMYAGSDTHDIIITGTSATYTMTCTAPASGNFIVGLRDTNAAGFGQVEIINQHLYKSTCSSTFVDTVAGYPRPHGVNSHRRVFTGGYNFKSLHHHAIGGGNGIANPCTFYWNMYMQPWVTPGRIFSLYGGTTYNLFASMETDAAAGKISAYRDGGRVYTTTTYSNYTWYVCCVVVNGASSLLRVNNEVVAANWGALDADGYIYGLGIDVNDGFSAPFSLTDVLGYYSAHDTGKQDRHFAYLKTKLGI